MFENYKNCLLNNEIVLKIQQAFRSDNHNVCTVEINKIALTSNDDKRLQTFDKTATYPYGTNTFKVCENKKMRVRGYTDCLFYGKNTR